MDKIFIKNKYILRFTEWYDSIGGVQLSTKEHNKRLLKKGFSIFQVYLSDNKKTKINYSHGKTFIEVSIYRYCEISNFDKILKEITKQNNISLALLNGLCFPYSLHICKILKSKEEPVPIIYHHHQSNSVLSDTTIKLSNENDLKQKIITIFDAMSHLVFLSEKELPLYILKKYRSKIKIIPDDIDLDYFKPVSSMNSKENIILFPARITPNKGHEDLLYICNYLRQKGMTFKILCIGPTNDVDFKKSVKTLVKDQFLENNILFVGSKSLDELKQLYNKGKVVISLSRTEGMGKVLQEAAAMKVPVVSYGTGGVSDVIKNGVNGYIIPPLNKKYFARSLYSILINEERRQRMAKNARKFISKYNSKIIFPEIIELYQNLMVN